LRVALEGANQKVTQSEAKITELHANVEQAIAHINKQNENIKLLNEQGNVTAQQQITELQRDIGAKEFELQELQNKVNIANRDKDAALEDVRTLKYQVGQVYDQLRSVQTASTAQEEKITDLENELSTRQFTEAELVEGKRKAEEERRTLITQVNLLYEQQNVAQEEKENLAQEIGKAETHLRQQNEQIELAKQGYAKYEQQIQAMKREHEALQQNFLGAYNALQMESEKIVNQLRAEMGGQSVYAEQLKQSLDEKQEAIKMLHENWIASHSSKNYYEQKSEQLESQLRQAEDELEDAIEDLEATEKLNEQFQISQTQQRLEVMLPFAGISLDEDIQEFSNAIYARVNAIIQLNNYLSVAVNNNPDYKQDARFQAAETELRKLQTAVNIVAKQDAKFRQMWIDTLRSIPYDDPRVDRLAQMFNNEIALKISGQISEDELSELRIQFQQEIQKALGQDFLNRMQQIKEGLVFLWDDISRLETGPEWQYRDKFSDYAENMDPEFNKMVQAFYAAGYKVDPQIIQAWASREFSIEHKGGRSFIKVTKY
jgi:hypothetical protein